MSFLGVKIQHQHYAGEKSPFKNAIHIIDLECESLKQHELGQNKKFLCETCSVKKCLCSFSEYP